MGGTFDEVLMSMVLDLVRSLLWERFGSEGWVRARCWVLRGRALIASAFWSWLWLVFVPLGLFCACRLVGVEGVPPVL